MNQTEYIKSFLILSSAFFFMGCSQHKIEADINIDPFEMMQELSDVSASASSNGNSFFNLANEETTSIYYSESGDPKNGALGTPKSILAFVDLSFLGNDIYHEDIERTRVYFLDSNTEEGREMALMIDVEFIDGRSPVTQVYFQEGDIVIEGDTLFVTLSGNGQTLYVSTDELAEGVTDLAPVIQLHFEVDLGDGQLSYIGKVSTLIGFE